MENQKRLIISFIILAMITSIANFRVPPTPPSGSIPLPSGTKHKDVPTLPVNQASNPSAQIPATSIRINIPNPLAVNNVEAPGASEPTHPNFVYHALISNSNPLYSLEPFVNRIQVPGGLATINSNNANFPIIAVIDTGFALNHNYLKDHWVNNMSEMGPTGIGSSQSCLAQGLSLDKRCNNVDNDGNGYLSDWRGWDFVHNDNDPSAGTTNPASSTATHGSLTASLAAALNPNARIMPLQALDDNGLGYTDTVAAAIHYAADNGANIISLSLGSTSNDNYLRSQIDYAISLGVTVVAAAGNGGCNCLSYPAAYPEVIAVGASDSHDNLASFSSFGSNLDVVAPGTASDVCGALWSASNQVSGYSCGFSGTSFATPIVASLASLLVTQDPGAEPDDIARFITQNADKVSGMGGQSRTIQYGYGRINVQKSVLAASLSTPQGELINKSTGSLSDNSLSNGPYFDSTCQGLPDSTCYIEISNQAGITKVLATQTLDEYGGANFIWNAAELELTSGQWTVTSWLTNFGQTTNRSEVVTISP